MDRLRVAKDVGVPWVGTREIAPRSPDCAVCRAPLYGAPCTDTRDFEVDAIARAIRLTRHDFDDARPRPSSRPRPAIQVVVCVLACQLGGLCQPGHGIRGHAGVLSRQLLVVVSWSAASCPRPAGAARTKSAAACRGNRKATAELNRSERLLLHNHESTPSAPTYGNCRRTPASAPPTPTPRSSFAANQGQRQRLNRNSRQRLQSDSSEDHHR